jgi:hypothetical protein
MELLDQHQAVGLLEVVEVDLVTHLHQDLQEQVELVVELPVVLFLAR